MIKPLRLAIQKSGRIGELSLSLLKSCDFRFPSTQTSRAIRFKAANFPLEVLLVRDDDIPQYVADGVADLGIVGDDVRQESGYNVNVVERFDFGHCRLALAVPNSSGLNSVQALQGKKIATSYPRSTEKFLKAQGIEADIHVISGSVEVAPSLGIADAISDIVSTGSTLILNGLKELVTISASQAVLISTPVMRPELDDIYNRMLFRIRSVELGKNLKYLMLNCERSRLQEIKELMKGLRSPTVLELAEKDWLAVHAVVPDDGLWDLVQSLKDHGAQGILVCPIEKMVN